jgi:hypothetical protein
MASHILEAYADDLQVRISGLEGGNPIGYEAEAHHASPELFIMTTTSS